MFGHNDDQQQNNDTPTPDGALGEQSTPQTDDTQSAPAVASDDSQSYLTDDAQTTTPDASMSTSDSTDEATLPAPASAASPASNDELLSIKQQALQQLTPLVGHLEQSPEEKFRTTMMMIQASDNDDLIKDAYTAAQAITDEKTRAQALLDIVNEINYFTQNQQ
jgi:hypothetical protein